MKLPHLMDILKNLIELSILGAVGANSFRFPLSDTKCLVSSEQPEILSCLKTCLTSRLCSLVSHDHSTGFCTLYNYKVSEMLDRIYIWTNMKGLQKPIWISGSCRPTTNSSHTYRSGKARKSAKKFLHKSCTKDLKKDKTVKKVKRAVVWKKAKKACFSKGGHLVKIDSPRKQTLVHKLVKHRHSACSGLFYGDGIAWIGLINKGNGWMWTDGTQVNYSNWEPGQPNFSYKHWPGCGLVYSNGEWNDADCKMRKCFLCEF